MEKRYQGIINGNYVMLMRVYIEKLFGIVDNMDHSIRLIPFFDAMFETVIND